MENRLLIDYLAFSIKIDTKSPVIYTGEDLSVSFLVRFMGLNESDLVDVGKVRWYKKLYRLGDISFMEPYDTDSNRQGFFVQMSGQGCRYYENFCKQGEFVTDIEVWRDFFNRLISLTKQGLAVNITRLDVAMDDFEGCLNLDEIKKCVLNGDYVSRFRSVETKSSLREWYYSDVKFNSSLKNKIFADSIYFGSRQSMSYLRIYDKLAEQLQKNYTDKKKMEELQAISHWIRFEFELKDERAMSIVASLCSEENFSSFYSEFVNGMIRFTVSSNDKTVTRRKLCDWWYRFIKTLSRVSLKKVPSDPVNAKKFNEYFYRHLSGSVYTAINLSGLDNFLDIVSNIVNVRGLKGKHRLLCAGLEDLSQPLCNSDKWGALIGA